MRRLRVFLTLCLGMFVLVVSWVLAVVVLAGLISMWLGWWTLLGIPLVLVLLFAGFMLFMGPASELEPDDGPVLGVFVASVFVAIVAGIVGVIMVGTSGPQIYHERYGERTTAVITYIGATNNESGGVTNWLQHVDDAATGADLGWLAQDPRADVEEGDRLEVSVDPRGWVGPVPVDSMGGTTGPAVTLLCCFGAVVLAALAIIGTALARSVLVDRLDDAGA